MNKPSPNVRVGLWRKLSAEELMLLNCGVGEDSWESLGLQGDPTSPSFLPRILGSSWVFLGRNDAKAETPVLRPPHAKSWLTGKDSDAGRDWGQEDKGTTEDEMAGWHHWLDGNESEWTPGVCDGRGGLACCNSWGLKESDTTERLNWTELNWICILTVSWRILILYSKFESKCDKKSPFVFCTFNVLKCLCFIGIAISGISSSFQSKVVFSFMCINKIIYVYFLRSCGYIDRVWQG